jgi:hypothetical protein
MAGMTLHWEAVPGDVVGAYRVVSVALSGSDFYLAGGTALALQLGHRISVDLDLFSPSLLAVEPLASTLELQLPDVRVDLTAPRTLYLDLQGVQVSLLGYDYPLLEPAKVIDPGLLPLAGVDDIGAMKLAAIASRGSRKDFIDLWWVVRSGRPLRDLLALYSRKFRSRDIGHVVRSLTYFDDAEREPPLRLLADTPWQRVTRDLIDWVEELLSAP